MPQPVVPFLAIALLILAGSLMNLYYRSQSNEKVRKLTRSTVSDLYAGKIEAADYANNLTELVFATPIVKLNFQNLSSLAGTTINDYYNVNNVYLLNDTSCLVLATILSYELKMNRGGLIREGVFYYKDFDKVYQAHLLIKIDPNKNETRFWSYQPEDEDHLNHLVELSEYFISVMTNKPYHFSIPPRPVDSWK